MLSHLERIDNDQQFLIMCDIVFFSILSTFLNKTLSTVNARRSTIIVLLLSKRIHLRLFRLEFFVLNQNVSTEYSL